MIYIGFEVDSAEPSENSTNERICFPDKATSKPKEEINLEALDNDESTNPYVISGHHVLYFAL